jgi:cob(I)alamin adenosyltransferase
MMTASHVKIYTKTGDEGETALFGGTRVLKSDARVDAYGEVDELNAWLGLARSQQPGAEIDAMLEAMQRDLFAIGAALADPRRKIAARVEKAVLSADAIGRLEEWIDGLEASLPPLRRFLLPGGSAAGAALHVARTVCRRAERRIVALGPDAVEPIVLTYMNRISDLLFVLARSANHRAGAAEVEW